MLATDLNFEVIKWIFVESFCIGLGISIQDIRDIKGDKITGRVTLPILLNEKIGILNTRIVFCLINVVIIPSITFLWLYDLNDNKQFICAIYLQLHQFYVAFRLFKYLPYKFDLNFIKFINVCDESINITKQDDITYQLWAMWFVILHLTSYCVIGNVKLNNN